MSLMSRNCAGLPIQVLRLFVDKYHHACGIKPICKVLQIVPSGYRCHIAQHCKPGLRSARAKMNEPLLPQIHQIWQSNMRVYGADKIWKQVRREGITVARCTAVRLMQRSGLRGIRPGKVVRTTTADATAARPLDRWTAEPR